MRLSFFSGACFGVAIGGFAGHFLVWSRTGPAQVAFHHSIETISPESSVIGGTDLLARLLEPEVTDVASTPAPQGAVVLNDPDHGDEPVHAEALVEVPSAENLSPPGVAVATPPDSLSVERARPIAPVAESVPAPDSATSVAGDKSSTSAKLDPEVVKMLKDELEGVSEQQQEIWADALQGMSPADAAGIIVMWKKFGQKAPGSDHLSGPPPLFRSSHPDQAPIPLQSSPLSLSNSNPASSVDDTQNLAARIAQHNEANRETCGYLVMVPVFSETRFEPGDAVADSRIIGFRLKLEGNRFHKTGNPSHVALQLGQFFRVRLPGGEEYFTRAGRLALDSERRLCVDLGDQDLPIVPEIKLPEGTSHPLVSQGRLRVVITGQPEPVPIDSLQVAVFFDPTRLQPQGNCLYSVTAGSGQPTMVAAELTQETLEYPSRSPVSLSAE